VSVKKSQIVISEEVAIGRRDVLLARQAPSEEIPLAGDAQSAWVGQAQFAIRNDSLNLNQIEKFCAPRNPLGRQ